MCKCDQCCFCFRYNILKIYDCGYQQDDTLTGDVSSVDIATKRNLLKLIDVGKNLLKKPLSRVNLESGNFEPLDGEGTNEEALAAFAKMLSDEKKLRLSP